MRRGIALASATLLVVIAGACSSDTSTASVALSEFKVVADPSSIPAGEITFGVSNIGEETHEVVLIRTDLAPDALPKTDDGSFDEEDLDVVDEIEDMEAGSSEELTVELAAGSYVLACNLVEEEEEDGETIVEAHYQEGMHTAFEVS